MEDPGGRVGAFVAGALCRLGGDRVSGDVVVNEAYGQAVGANSGGLGHLIEGVTHIRGDGEHD